MKDARTQMTESATKGDETPLALSSEYLSEDDRVLIVDDFLFTGLTSEALTKLVDDVGAELVGYAFVISKKNFGGCERLGKYEKPIFVLVEVESLDPVNKKVNFGDVFEFHSS
jgi:xanthine phosphoribosyltransferase